MIFIGQQLTNPMYCQSDQCAYQSKIDKRKLKTYLMWAVAIAKYDKENTVDPYSKEEDSTI